VGDKIENAIEELQSRLIFQEDLIQKLDDALGSQQQQIIQLGHRISLLMDQVKMMEHLSPEMSQETPPPHY